MSNSNGRPLKPDKEKKLAYIRFRCHEDEKKQIVSLSKSYGLSMTDYILKKALDKKVVFNHIELIKEIHEIGTELSRAGNNINQLSKHANTLNKSGRLNESIIHRLNIILDEYNENQDKIRVAFRRIIRELTK